MATFTLGRKHEREARRSEECRARIAREVRTEEDVRPGVLPGDPLALRGRSRGRRKGRVRRSDPRHEALNDGPLSGQTTREPLGSAVPFGM